MLGFTAAGRRSASALTARTARALASAASCASARSTARTTDASGAARLGPAAGAHATPESLAGAPSRLVTGAAAELFATTPCRRPIASSSDASAATRPGLTAAAHGVFAAASRASRLRGAALTAATPHLASTTVAAAARSQQPDRDPQSHRHHPHGQAA